MTLNFKKAAQFEGAHSGEVKHWYVTILQFIQFVSVMATKATVEEFDVEQLCDFLSSSGDISEDAVDKFRSNQISGSTFFELDESDLR